MDLAPLAVTAETVRHRVFLAVQSLILTVAAAVFGQPELLEQAEQVVAVPAEINQQPQLLVQPIQAEVEVLVAEVERFPLKQMTQVQQAAPASLS